MPSRRTVLAAAGGALVVGAGCVDPDRRVDGYVQLKSVTGVSESEDRLVYETVVAVDASHAETEPPELRHLDDRWRDRFETPRTPLVSDALHADLSRAFDRVRYVVGVTSPSWADEGESVGSYNVSTTRENFNRVQVHDRVTASSDGTYLTVHSVDGVWTFESA